MWQFYEINLIYLSLQNIDRLGKCHGHFFYIHAWERSIKMAIYGEKAILQVWYIKKIFWLNDFFWTNMKFFIYTFAKDSVMSTVQNFPMLICSDKLDFSKSSNRFSKTLISPWNNFVNLGSRIIEGPLSKVNTPSPLFVRFLLVCFLFVRNFKWAP